MLVDRNPCISYILGNLVFVCFDCWKFDLCLFLNVCIVLDCYHDWCLIDVFGLNFDLFVFEMNRVLVVGEMNHILGVFEMNRILFAFVMN